MVFFWFSSEALTNNKARTASLVKYAFTKTSGNFCPTAFMFTRRGWVTIVQPETKSFDELFDELVEMDLVEDIIEGSPRTAFEKDEADDKIVTVYTEHSQTARLFQVLRDNQNVAVKDYGIEYSPNEDTQVARQNLEDEKIALYNKLIGNLEDLDDVTEVYSNLV